MVGRTRIAVAALNDTSKLDEIDLLKIPRNLTRSFTPLTLQAKNYKDGFEKVFHALSNANHHGSALIILPLKTTGFCGCYKQDLNFTQQLMNYTNGIYQQAQRSQPIIYLDESKATQAFDWVTSISKINDMITS